MCNYHFISCEKYSNKDVNNRGSWVWDIQDVSVHLGNISVVRYIYIYILYIHSIYIPIYYLYRYTYIYIYRYISPAIHNQVSQLFLR